MSLEIVKQLFDVAALSERTTSLDTVRSSFVSAVSNESRYREVDTTQRDVALDVIGTALSISSEGKVGRGDWDELRSGIARLKSYVFSDVYTQSLAKAHAARAAYVAAVVAFSTNDRMQVFESPESIDQMRILEPALKPLNKLRKTSPESLFYWYHTVSILEDAGISIT